MEILEKVIASFSKEEQRNFKLFALRSHDDQDRKDIQLFDAIRKSGEALNERKLIKSLYGGAARANTYHRLRNRLLGELGKSLALLNWDKDETAATLHYLTLAMLYKRKQLFDIAAYYLQKAEKKAEKIDFPELLDLIYGEFISLSFELESVNPEYYVTKRNVNRQRLNQLWEIDNVLSLVNHRLRHSQNLGMGNQQIMDLLSRTVEELSLKAEITSDPKFRFKMYNAVSKIFLEKRDYEALEDYLLKTYEAFQKDQLFNKGNHETKLQMLTYIINTLFKNGKTEESLRYADLLKEAMEQFGQMLKAKYLFFYYNSLVLNYSSSDFQKAVEILEQMLSIEQIASVPQYVVYIMLNLAVSEYALKRYKPAIRHLVKLGLQDAIHSADQGFRLRIAIFELALRLELEDIETLEYRMAQVKSDFDELLSNAAMEKDARMLELIAQLALVAPEKPSAALRAEILSFLEQYPANDTEIFKYGEFLMNLIG